MDNTASYLPSSKKDLFDHHDEGGNINKKKKVAATTGAAANKKNVSNAVKALGKASTQGMKKISSFFVKK